MLKVHCPHVGGTKVTLQIVIVAIPSDVDSEDEAVGGGVATSHLAPLAAAAASVSAGSPIASAVMSAIGIENFEAQSRCEPPAWQSPTVNSPLRNWSHAT